MSRPKKILRKKFVVFCEGDTEYNYINQMRRNQGVEIAIEPVNMHGGGYANFLNVIRTKSYTNCLAKFIIVDADRLNKEPGEKNKFEELLAYCTRQNKMQTVPHFLILDQPDFEYIACLHDLDYKGQDTTKHITGAWGYRDLEDFKSDANVYHVLNTGNKGYETMLRALNPHSCMLRNDYCVRKNRFEIEIKDTKVDWDNSAKRASNINEFFDVIDW